MLSRLPPHHARREGGLGPKVIHSPNNGIYRAFSSHEGEASGVSIQEEERSSAGFHSTVFIHARPPVPSGAWTAGSLGL